MKVEAQLHPFHMNEVQRSIYSVLGRFHHILTGYEFDCDEFVFSIAEKRPYFISKNRIKSPFNKNPSKIEFVKLAIEQLPELSSLRDIRIGSKELTLAETMNWIWYHRNNMNHGKLFFSSTKKEKIAFRFTRWVQDSEDRRRTFHRTTYAYDIDLLSEIVDATGKVRSLLQTAKNSIELKEDAN